jgi:hypothetical protein
MYQRGKIQEESLHYETLKHSGELPIIGVNTFLGREGSPTARAGRARCALVIRRSILSGEDRESVPLDHERIVELAPDHFVISWCGVPEHRYRKELVLDEPALAGIPAVKKRQVHAIREAYLGRPGPRLVEGYHALCHILASS